MLVVLVRLNGDAGQSGIAGDRVGFPKNAVAGRKAAFEELQQIDLAASGGQRVEVHVVDVNVAFAVRLGVLGFQDEHFIELLGAFTSVLQHGAHRGIAVDVGVLALDVTVAGILESNIFIDLHQPGVHLAHSASVRAVQDVGFSGTYVTGVDQYLFHHVLDALDIGDVLNGFFHSAGNFSSQFGSSFFVLGEPGSGKGFFDSAGYFALIERHSASVTFYDFADHIFSLDLLVVSYFSIIRNDSYSLLCLSFPHYSGFPASYHKILCFAFRKTHNIDCGHHCITIISECQYPLWNPLLVLFWYN